MQFSTWKIAWRNLWRNRKRTVLALLAIAVGQWALLATRGAMRGYADNIQNAITGPMLGHVQLHDPQYREERAIDLTIGDVAAKTAVLRALPHVADATPRIYAPVLCAPHKEAFIATVVGIDLESESKPFGLLSGFSGRLQPGQVLLGYRLARNMQAAAGQEIALVGQAADGSFANDLYTVAGIVNGPSDLVNQTGVVMRLDDAQRLLAMPDMAHEFVIRADGVESVPELLLRLQAEPALRGLEVIEWRALMPEMVMIMAVIGYSAYLVLALMLVAAVAGIANTVMMSTYERMQEFGMLLALGCTPGRIVRMILIEAVLIGVLGVLIGTLMGWGFNVFFHHVGIDMAALGGQNVKELAVGGLQLPLEIRTRMQPTDPIIGLVSVVIVSLGAALWPAVAAGRLDPMEAMRK